MCLKSQLAKSAWYGSHRSLRRRVGGIAVLSAVLLSVLFAFVAFGVDSGRVVGQKTKMQNACDAAALGASQEFVKLVYQNGKAQVGMSDSALSISEENARQVAKELGEANGVYVDPQKDVFFGKRGFDPQTNSWTINWGEKPYNVVRVVARRDQLDAEKPDGQFPLVFGWAVGKSKVSIATSSIAYIEARDIVLVLDYSASMNDDSSLQGATKYGKDTIENLLDDMWDQLVQQDPKWPDSGESKFPPTGFGLVNSYAGTRIASNNTSQILQQLGVLQTSNGVPVFPFPQSGRDAMGYPNPKPNIQQNQALWTEYVQYVQKMSGSYRYQFGYRTMLDFLQERRYLATESEDLWRTPQYPLEAVKQGATMFCDFLEDLDFGDQLGIVSYGGYAVRETGLVGEDITFDISSDPITEDYSKINAIQIHRQAGHYEPTTGMGFGIKEAREMMFGETDQENAIGYLRFGSRPTMIIMTDGQTNRAPSRWKLPAGWKWEDWTDYNGDFKADYKTNDVNKQYAFWEATECVKKGITIHTMSVGRDADGELMKAIAFAGRGVWLDVPGGMTLDSMEEEVTAAFNHIAARVPPPKIIYDEQLIEVPDDEDDSNNYPTYGDLQDDCNKSQCQDGCQNNCSNNPNISGNEEDIECSEDDKTKGNNGLGNGLDPQPPGDPPVNDGDGTSPGNPGNQGGCDGSCGDANCNSGSGGGNQDCNKGNNGVGNGLDPQPPGDPPVNDGDGTSPGNPGNQGGCDGSCGDANCNSGSGGGNQDCNKGNNGVGNGLDPQPPGDPPVNDGDGTSPGNPGNQGGANSGDDPNNDSGTNPDKGNNGVGNGLDPQPPGDPPVNDGDGTSPGNPGNQGGSNSDDNSGDNSGNGPDKGNNGVGNGEDPQPPGDPPVNDGAGTSPGSPGNQGGKK